MQERTRLFGRPRSSLTRRRMLGGSLAAGSGLSAAALVGCGGDNDDDAAATTEEPRGDGEPSPSPTLEIPPEMVVANEAEPDDLMPFVGGFGQALVMRAVNEPMVNVVLTEGNDGSAEIEHEGVLAESWERADETTWNVRLRQGVSFHDGSAWNADVAKANYDIFMDDELVASLGKPSLAGRLVDSVDAIDEYTLQFKTPFPMSQDEFFGYTFYLGFSGFSLPALDELGIEGMAENPVGTGPYRFESWTRGEDIHLVRNDDYWGELPNMRNLRFITRSEAAVRAQTVQAGEAHFAFNVGAEQAESLENSVIGGGFQSNSLRMNNQLAPTNDIRIRRAINYAIDREGINEAIFGGTATAISFFAYQPVDLDPWPYDPAEARRLVEESGLEDTELELVYGEGRIPEEDQLAEIFKAQIEDTGVTVSLNKLEPLQYEEISSASFENQPTLLMETTSSGNYGTVANGLLDKYGCDGSGTFCDEDYDAAFQELLALEGEERLQHLQEIATALLEDETPRAWVVAINQVHGLGPDVTADLPLNTYPRWEDIQFA